MRSSGNGAPKVCANNLLRIVRGEAPYERVKGIDPRIIDKPQPVASSELEADAEWLIETYEPRVQFEGINTAPDNSINGGFIVTANITEKEG